MVAVKDEPTKEEIRAREEENFAIGPLSVLTNSVKRRAQVLINCRNNKKLLGRVKAFDRWGRKKFCLKVEDCTESGYYGDFRHFNMVLEEVREMWTVFPKKGKGQKKARAVQKDRYISKLFLRGDSVILVVKNPIAQDKDEDDDDEEDGAGKPKRMKKE